MGLRYVTMPKWGIEMAQGTLTEWHVSEGDVFAKGQLIALVETDKITNEMEADEPGVMHKILVPEGEIKIVGELLAVIGDADDSASNSDPLALPTGKFTGSTVHEIPQTENISRNVYSAINFRFVDFCVFKRKP